MVDGQSYKKDDALWNADNMCTAYQVSGLEDGEHTVTIEVASGSLAVDAIAVIGSIYNSDEINVTPKKGTETGLPEEELPKRSDRGCCTGYQHSVTKSCSTRQPPRQRHQNEAAANQNTVCPQRIFF